ncbi:MAG TPA: DNA circularization N-terminal domain-containing protein [Candidatus Cybelea sp.]|nr:DNA circularization N-terminal domain-containing protein [Candidatus Cybelea sp.]
MASLLEHSPVMWRKKLRQASFKAAAFHVEHQGRVSGRRTVLHEYPKRDIPYAEDMGRHAVRYQITGYVIQRWGSSPIGNMPPNYDVARDQLIRALESSGPGTLVDPYNNSIGPMQFQCERYSLTETRERGGYAQFEMAFVEAGEAAFTTVGTDTAATVNNAADNSRAAASTQLNQQMTVANNPAGLPLLI